MERLSQRTSLYSYKSSKPSISGSYIQEEITEMTRWANQSLSVGGFSEHHITDLATDLSDGITLLRLVQSLAREPLPQHSPNPMMKVQKIENFQVVLGYLKRGGIVLTVHPEELAGGSVKAVLAVCKALKRHYSADPSPQSGRGARVQRPFSYSSLDKEDMSILSWVGEVVHRNISDYTALYDGRVLCELVNELKEDTLQVMPEWSSEQRLREVLSASERHFFIPHSSIDVRKISTGSQDKLLRSFLQQMKTVHIQRSWQQPHISTRSTRPQTHSREEVFSSLRGNSLSQEQREEAKIAAKSYDGLRQSRKTGSHSDLTKSSKPLTKHSSTEALQKAPLFPPLDRHYSVDTGIAPTVKRPPPPPLFRSTSQTIPQSMHHSTESINTPTYSSTQGLKKRAPSYTRLERSSADDQVTLLEERLATLTAQFLFERYDMYKRMDRALVRERKRRQLVEKRLKDVEGMAKALVKHYDCKVIELAKQVSVLRGEMLLAQNRPTPIAMEIQGLKDEVQQLSQPAHPRTHTSSSNEAPPTHPASTRKRSNTLFVRKMEPGPAITRPSPLRKRSNTQTVSKPPTEQVYCRGSLTSFKKLSNFFGAEPPRLEDITTFLDGLGYSDLIQVFKTHDITLAELSVMGDKDLERLQIPLGPRVRLLQELKKLQPLSEGTII